MIKIEITDPHLLDKKVLHDTVAFLLRMGGDQLIPITPNVAAVSAEVHPEVVKNPNQPDFPIVEEHEKAFNPFLTDLDRKAWGLPADLPPPELATRPTFRGKEVDSKGMPWISRIHTRTKSRDNDGSWRYQRGISQQIIDEEEAKALGLPAPAQVVPVSPPAPVAIPAPIVTPPAPTPIAANMPVAPPVAVVAPPIPVPATVINTDVTFQSIMQVITTAMINNQLSRQELSEFVKSFDIPSLPVLASRPDLLPEFNKNLHLLLGIEELNRAAS